VFGFRRWWLLCGEVLLHDLVRSRMRTAPSPPLSIAAAVALSNRSQVVFFSVTNKS
jgi:hypothetical protein